MTLYDLFVTFIFTTPKRQTIDHKEGWCGCAVGDFARDQDIDAEDIAGELAEGNPRLLTALNLAGSGYRREADLSTYGKLQEYILGQEEISGAEYDYALGQCRGE